MESHKRNNALQEGKEKNRGKQRYADGLMVINKTDDASAL